MARFSAKTQIANDLHVVLDRKDVGVIKFRREKVERA